MRRRAAVAVVALVLAAACSGGDDGGAAGGGGGGSVPATGERSRDDLPTGGTLRMGIARLGSLDPALATPESPSTTIAADLLFDGLDVLAEPGTTPDGGRTWQFALRAGVVFGDGTPVTAADVEASLERVPGRPIGLDVRPFGDGAVEIALGAPMASFPDLLAAPAYGIVPGAAVAAGDFLAAAAAGSGPFRLAGAEGDVLSLVRAPGGGALLDGVDLHQFDGLGDAYDAYEAGLLDWALLPADRAEAAAERHGTGGFVPSTTTLAFVFEGDAVADVRLRRAVVSAVDRDALVRALYLGVADPVEVLVPPGVPGHDGARCAAGCAHDDDLARALVTEVAAAAAASGGALAQLVVDDGDGPAGLALGQAVVGQLADVGIPAVVGDAAGGAPVSLRQVVLAPTYPGPEVYLTRLAGPGAAGVREGLARLAVTFDAAARATLVGELEGFLLGEATVLPIATFRTLTVARDHVHDLALSPTGTISAAAAWLE